MNPATNLILVGPMGAGKSCIAHLLAGPCGLRLVDLDREIERRAGTRVAAVFEREGEAGFRTREKTALAEVLIEGADAPAMLLATGGGVVLDADNRRLLRAGGFVVHLHASPAQQLRRLADDVSRPLLQRDDRAEALAGLAAQRAPLYAQVADLRFDTDHLDVTAVAAGLIETLALRWQRREAA